MIIKLSEETHILLFIMVIHALLYVVFSAYSSYFSF